MYKTGDIGKLTEDGSILYLGRNDSQVKLLGHRIELAEVESVLGRHPLVNAVAVTVYAVSYTHLDVYKRQVMRALTSAYAGRKQRKRQMRQLWIARINAAARMNGLSYSKFMHGLKLANIDVNRKMLAELAVNDAEGFATLAELAKAKVA